MVISLRTNAAGVFLIGGHAVRHSWDNVARQLYAI